MSHLYEHRNFIIFNVNELNKIDWDAVLETSSETIRKSVDGSKTFVKWDGETPECVLSLDSKQGPYNYDEIVEILANSEWTENTMI
jgi:hypothetical protein